MSIIKGTTSRSRTYSSKREFKDAAMAMEALGRAKERLFNVDNWPELPGYDSAFELYDASGRHTPEKKPSEGDFIRIVVPGPFPENWVKVDAVHEDKMMAEFTVSPSEDPRSKDGEIRHFFSKEARSTFRVELKQNTLYAYEIGVREKINNRGREAGDRKVINTLMAQGGWMFFQKIQWKKLTKYLVDV